MIQLKSSREIDCMKHAGCIAASALAAAGRAVQEGITTGELDRMIYNFITSKGKGVTRVEGRGGFTGQPRPVLISMLEPRQVVQLKHFLKEKGKGQYGT